MLVLPINGSVSSGGASLELMNMHHRKGGARRVAMTSLFRHLLVRNVPTCEDKYVLSLVGGFSLMWAAIRGLSDLNGLTQGPVSCSKFHCMLSGKRTYFWSPFCFPKADGGIRTHLN